MWIEKKSGGRGRAAGHWPLLFCVFLVWAAVPALGASQEAVKLNQAAVDLATRGQYEEAIKLFLQARQLDPGEELIRKNLAQVRLALGHQYLMAAQFQKAQEQYEASLEAVPDDVAALAGLGDAQLRQREARSAADTYQRAIRLDPRNPDLYARLGEAYYQQGDLNSALAEWKTALELRPEDEPLRNRIEKVEKEARVERGYKSRESQHFAVTYEGTRMEDLGRDLVDILEQAYTEVGYALGEYPPNPIPTIFYSNKDFVAVTGYSTGVGGLYGARDGKIRIALRGLKPDDPELRATLYHEYTHALIYAVTRGNNPPHWVHEGLAVYMEKERGSYFREGAIEQAKKGLIPPLDSSPYVHGFVAMEYLIERQGIAPVQDILRKMGRGAKFNPAFREAVGMDFATFEQSLREVLIRGY